MMYTGADGAGRRYSTCVGDPRALRLATHLPVTYSLEGMSLEHDVRVLKWMLGTMGPLLIALVAGLYVVLFNLTSRLPR